MLNNSLLIFLLSFTTSIIFAPLVLLLCKKIKASQTILNYVEEHKGKQGTPTMGGMIFITASIIICACLFNKDSSLGFIALAVMLSYGILGFLDDFIKIYYKQNLGLKAYQKIIGQVGISLIIALFAYKNNYISSNILIPFTDLSIDLKWGIIPFIMFVYIAVVNSVNLLDGLDGLAGSVSFVICLAYGIIVYLISKNYSQTMMIESHNLSLSCFAVCGALLGFLLLNVYPAKIFMGDTGSLALGGFICSVAVFSRQELLLPILGISLVITALSDIIQVVNYKKTKKRIFLMAPLHHHFQKKGFHENKIVFSYVLVTLFISVLTILLYSI